MAPDVASARGADNPATSVSVAGLGKLRRALREAGVSVEDLKDAHAAVSQLVAAAAASRAPRRSGRLAASVRGTRAAGKASVLAGGSAVPYAAPIHWGWPARHIAAQPFASDAATQTESAWLPVYAAELERIADAVGGHY